MTGDSGTSSRFGRLIRGRRPVRIVAVVLAVLLLAAMVGGVAWALDMRKAKKFEAAATYYVTAPANEGEEQFFDLLKVGRATIRGSCVAGTAPELGGWGIFGWFGIVNNGPNPILLTHPYDGNEGPDYMWLEPGQEDPWMGGGQWAAADSGGDAGYMMSFAILDEGGTSVTGTAAWSARWNAPDETGHCVLSVQVKG